jgi:2-methylisocitrate lyase-like PEP mutase family enzyme
MYAAAGASMVKATSRALRTADELWLFKASASVPVWLGVVDWLELLPREDLERSGDLIDFAFVPLMSSARAMIDNLQALAREKSSVELPSPRLDHRELSRMLGQEELDATLSHYDA